VAHFRPRIENQDLSAVSVDFSCVKPKKSRGDHIAVASSREVKPA
jgi:hypothetical protein